MTEASETASGWCMGISNVCKRKPRALPVPAACILFIPQQRERWQSISEEPPFVIPTAAPFPVHGNDAKIITISWIMGLSDQLPCDCAAAAVAWFCTAVISCGERSTLNTPGLLGSAHLPASLYTPLHPGLFFHPCRAAPSRRCASSCCSPGSALRDCT